MNNNDCKFIGRITKDLEMQNSNNGNQILLFDLAVQREFKNSNNEYDSDFISCIAFNKTAIFISNYAKKGYLIGVEGRLQNNNFERDDGTINYGMKLVVNKVNSQILFLNKSKNSESNIESNKVQRGQNKSIESNNQTSDNNPFFNANGPVEISDDDLPF